MRQPQHQSETSLFANGSMTAATVSLAVGPKGRLHAEWTVGEA